MTEETWDISIGDRVFTVPRLPFKYSRVVYPICQRLSNADLAERIVFRPDPLQLSDEEMNDLGTIAFVSCQAADPELTREAFDDMPITPPQLYDAFFAIRKACGGWIQRTEDQETPGEEKGAKKPRKSTSTASSEN